MFKKIDNYIISTISGLIEFVLALLCLLAIMSLPFIVPALLAAYIWNQDWINVLKIAGIGIGTFYIMRSISHILDTLKKARQVLGEDFFSQKT